MRVFGLFMNKHSGQHCFNSTFDTRTEDIKRVGFPLVTFPLHSITTRTDIHHRRIALGDKRVSQLIECLGMLCDDFIRNIVFLMHLHFQSVVLQAEITFVDTSVPLVLCV